MRIIFAFFILSFLLTPSLSFSAEILQDKQEIIKARVVSIVDQGTKDDTFVDKELFYQNLKSKI